MDWLTAPNAWIALLTLTVLEIVLGIDNIVFISILAGKLPDDQRKRARTIGLVLAMLIRRQLSGQDRDEDDVVDAQDDLERGQREQGDPRVRVGEDR